MSNLRIFRITSIIISVILISVISVVSPQIKERNIDTTITQLGLNDNSTSINFFSPKHESHIIPALRMFQQKPIIGFGPNTFRKYCNDVKFKYNEHSCTTHPHHTISQLLGEIGLIGIIFFLAVIFYVLKVILFHIKGLLLRSEKKLDDYQVCILACFLCTLWPILPTLNFFNNWISIVYYLPIGFYLQTIYKTARN